MLKKILSLVVVGVMVFSLSACGGNGNNLNAENDNKSGAKTVELTIENVNDYLNLVANYSSKGMFTTENYTLKTTSKKNCKYKNAAIKVFFVSGTTNYDQKYKDFLGYSENTLREKYKADFAEVALDENGNCTYEGTFSMERTKSQCKCYFYKAKGTIIESDPLF